MVRIFRLFMALPIALPLIAQSAETRNENGATATMEHIYIDKPEIDGYATSSVRVATTNTPAGPRRVADVYLLECTRANTQPCTVTYVLAHLPMEALAVTGKTAVFEHDYAEETEVLHRESFTYDATGHFASVPYVPKSIRLVFTENGITSTRTNGTELYRFYDRQIKTTGQSHTFSAYATGTIFGNTIRGVGYAQVGTSHSTVVERTKTENPSDEDAGTGTP